MAEGLDPILILTIDANHPLRVDQVAGMVDRLAGEFERFQQSMLEAGDRHTFRFHDLHTGSLIAKLIAVADAASTIVENRDALTTARDLLAGFYNQLFDAMQLLMGSPRARVASSDRRTIEIMAAPVAEDGAQQVCIQLFGDNSRVIVITPDTVRQLKAGSARKGPRAPKSLAKETAEDRATIESIRERHRLLLAADKLGPGASEYLWSSRGGTLVCVDGEWYVRYLGGGGALAPLRASTFDRKALDPGRRYTVDGEILKSVNGEVTGFDADSIDLP